MLQSSTDERVIWYLVMESAARGDSVSGGGFIHLDYNLESTRDEASTTQLSASNATNRNLTDLLRAESPVDLRKTATRHK
jgi:hypothetical protein